MDYDELRQDLTEISEPERDHVVAGIAQLVYEFPRILAKKHRDGAEDPWQSTALGFIGRLIDVTAAAHLWHYQSPRDFWEIYGHHIVPFAMQAAYESGLIPESLAREIEAGFDAWRGKQQIHVESQDQVPVGLMFAGILGDRWSYWEAQLLRRRATNGQAPNGQAEKKQMRPVPEGATAEKVPPDQATPRAPGQKRGPKTDYEMCQKVADIVKEVVPVGDWHPRLIDICAALDDAKVPVPSTWKKRRWTSWSDYDGAGEDIVIKAIEYRLLKAAEKDKIPT